MFIHINAHNALDAYMRDDSERMAHELDNYLATQTKHEFYIAQAEWDEELESRNNLFVTEE